MDQQGETVIPNTEKTILNEQKSTHGANVGADSDVGRNMTEDTSTQGGGLAGRLEEVDQAQKNVAGAEKADAFAPKIGTEDESDLHSAAASKQP